MNLQQLTSLCEVVDRNLNISLAAKSLGKTQPNISRQIFELEQEFGIAIFERSSNRLVGITHHGNEIIGMARRVVFGIRNLHALKEEISSENVSAFTLATTHTLARHLLPEIMKKFNRQFPNTKIVLRQGDPEECFDLVARDKVEIAVCTGVSSPKADETVFIPCFRVNRCIIAPAGHPLLRSKPITLQAIANIPLLRLGAASAVRRSLSALFLNTNCSRNF